MISLASDPGTSPSDCPPARHPPCTDSRRRFYGLRRNPLWPFVKVTLNKAVNVAQLRYAIPQPDLTM